MLGAMGISLNVREWPPELKAQVGREIAFYKANRRFLFGDLYRLTPQTVIFNKTWEPPKQWEMVQYYLPETRESMVYCFRDEGEQTRAALVPRRIDPGKSYRVMVGDSGVLPTLSGADILAGKLEVALHEPFSVRVVHLSER